MRLLGTVFQLKFKQEDMTRQQMGSDLLCTSCDVLMAGNRLIVRDSGVQYTIADDTKQCSIDPIPVDARGFDAVYNITRQTLGMRKPLQFLNLDSKSYLYAGRRKARGQQCDVFQAVLTNIPGHGIVVYEVYFLTVKINVLSLSPSLCLSLSLSLSLINQLLNRAYNICLWYCRVYLCL